jgi:integrase
MPKKNHLEAYIDYLQKNVLYSRSTKLTYQSVTKRFLRYVISQQTGKNLKDIKEEELNTLDVILITPELVNGYISLIRQENAIDSQTSIFYALRKYIYFLEKEYQNKTYDYYRQIDISNMGKKKRDLEYTQNPLTPQRRNKTTRTPLTKEETDKFFEVSKSNPRDYAIFKTLYFTTQRRDSITHINTKDIDRENMIIRILAKGKDGTPREYPVSIDSEVLEAIDTYLKVREEPKEGYIVDNWGIRLYHKEALFLNGCGGRYTNAGIYFMIKKYCNIIGIKRRVSPHIFRHTGISDLNASGLSEAQIMTQSGHSNSRSLQRYINTNLTRTQPLISKALSRKPQQPEKPTPTPIEKPKDTTDTYISKDYQDTNHIKELELLVERQKLELANKQAEIELFRLKQTHSDTHMYG